MSTSAIATRTQQGSGAKGSLSAVDFVGLPVEWGEARWYAVCTSPHHEKWVAGEITASQIECFLPLYKSVRHWQDRKKILNLPLFPGYVFVHISLADRVRVLRLPGAIQFVSFQGKPSSLPDPEIEMLRKSVDETGYLEPHPYLKTGCRVRVRRGPMQGVEGVLIRRKDSYRVVLTIELIMQSFALEVDLDNIEMCH